MYKLFAHPGWGSTLTEAQLAWYGLPFEVEDGDNLFKSSAARERLAKVNPLPQLPTLVLPDGRIMTASAAITLHLADTPPAEQSLAPLNTGAERERLGHMVENIVDDGPWFLGARFSALDIYISVMTRWTPRRGWFVTNA